MRLINIIIEDFISSTRSVCGCGVFQENELAIDFAKQLTISQIRKYRRYGKIPLAFREYLEADRRFVIKHARSTGKSFHSTGILEPILEHIEREYLKWRLPELDRSFPSADHIWACLEMIIKRNN